MIDPTVQVILGQRAQDTAVSRQPAAITASAALTLLTADGKTVPISKRRFLPPPDSSRCCKSIASAPATAR